MSIIDENEMSQFTKQLLWLFHYDEKMVNKDLVESTYRLNEDGVEAFISESVREVGSDIFTFPFLNREFCDFLALISKANGRWKPEAGDHYSAPEMRLKAISPCLEDTMNRIILKHARPVIRKLFGGVYDIGWIGAPFLIRYDLETQIDMGLHFDGMSDVTISIPILNDFKGDGLCFPRQNYKSNGLIEGSAIVFPGGPSHIHEAKKLTCGERITLTIWTKNSPP